MGFKKHRHSKDKLYIRAVEWEQEFGGYKKQQSLRQFKRLPFVYGVEHFTSIRS